MYVHQYLKNSCSNTQEQYDIQKLYILLIMHYILFLSTFLYYKYIIGTSCYQYAQIVKLKLSL